MKAILKKLYGNKPNANKAKTQLREIKLSKVDELKEQHADQLQTLQNAMNPVLNAISEAKENLVEIQDVLDSAYLVDTSVGALIEDVESLGVDVPEDLQQLKNETEAFAEIGDIHLDVESALQNAEDIISDIYQRYF